MASTIDTSQPAFNSLLQSETLRNRFIEAKNDIETLEASIAGVVTATNIGDLINSVAVKTTPVDADQLALMDSAAGNSLKKLSWANLKTALKPYFDPFYVLTVDMLGSLINSASIKVGPVDADQVALMDSAAGNVVKKVSWFNFKKGLKTYFDTIYESLEPPLVSKSVDYTFILTDSGKSFLHPSADTTARTFTIPANALYPFAIGSKIKIINQNAAGVLTIAITTDTLRLAGAGTTGSRTLAANGLCEVRKVGAAEWIISGEGLS